jgi:hypothetical protein
MKSASIRPTVRKARWVGDTVRSRSSMGRREENGVTLEAMTGRS